MKTIFTLLIGIVLTTAGSMFLMNRYVRVAVPAATPVAKPAPVTVEVAPQAEPVLVASVVRPAETAAADEARVVVAYDRLADDLAEVSRTLDRFNGLIGDHTDKLRSDAATKAVQP